MAFMKRFFGRADAVETPQDDVVLDEVAEEVSDAVSDAVSSGVAVEAELAPEPKKKLRDRLGRTSGGFSQALKSAFGARTDEEIWQGVEDALLMADVGLAATTKIVAAARKRAGRTASEEQVRAALKQEVLTILNNFDDRDVHGSEDGISVVLVVGVNGTGKTTSTGKLAKRWVDEGNAVVLGAADTFRAAAADQLETWAQRAGADIVRGPENGDPAAVAFDAVARGIETNADVVLLDTAGRLHTKAGLMDELSKIRRVVERKAAIDEVLLVIDATTGQNGVAQAKVFAEAVDVTGIVLSKLDGSAKGGVVVAVQELLGVPVKYVGIGEGADDLIDFNPDDFVDALFA
jgi:fused signal recognition particle receptor